MDSLIGFRLELFGRTYLRNIQSLLVNHVFELIGELRLLNDVQDDRQGEEPGTGVSCTVQPLQIFFHLAQTDD